MPGAAPVAAPGLAPQSDSSQSSAPLSLEAVGGELWTLFSMDGQPIPKGCSAPTVQFTGVRLASFGGCNVHMGTIQETAPGEIKVSTLAGGRKACPPVQMNLDQEFVSRLEKVDRYAFVEGRLALSGEARGEPFLLLFDAKGQ
jgi:heat shock protein HslJ